VVDRLLARGVSLWRTDQDGTVAVSVDGTTIRVSGRGRRETVAVRGEQ